MSTNCCDWKIVFNTCTSNRADWRCASWCDGSPQSFLDCTSILRNSLNHLLKGGHMNFEIMAKMSVFLCINLDVCVRMRACMCLCVRVNAAILAECKFHKYRLSVAFLLVAPLRLFLDWYFGLFFISYSVCVLFNSKNSSNLAAAATCNDNTNNRFYYKPTHYYLRNQLCTKNIRISTIQKASSERV